jgi:hypothetical protein
MQTGMKAWLATLAVTLHAVVARAGNDDGILLGNDAALSAGAVTATVADGSALWYNPAGLADARLDTVDVSGSAFVLRSYRMPNLLAASDGSHGDGDFNEIVSVPSALTFVRNLSAHTTVGLALFVPQYNDFVLRASLTTHDQLVTRWQVALRQQQVQYHGGLGIGWGPHPRVSAGFGLFGVYSKFSGSSQVAGGVEDMAGTTTFGFSTQSLLEEASLIGAELAAGIIVRPIDRLSLGLSVRSPSLSFYESTRVTSVSTAADVADPASSLAEFELSDDRSSGGKVGLFAPARVRLGVALLVAGGTIAIEGDVQHALENEGLYVDRTLVWNARLGARFPVSERMLIGAGLFTDRGADPELPSGAGPLHFYGGTAGVQYSNVHKLDASERQQKLTFATTLALRYAHGRGKLEGDYIDIERGYEIRNPAVSIDVDEVSLHIGSALYF